MNTTIPKENIIESMRDRLADNDACNYAQGYDTNTLYKIMREGIKGYDKMTDQEVSRIHEDVFGWIEDCKYGSTDEHNFNR